MSTDTGISWCDSTWNPLVGCARVSGGCAACYAIPNAHRLAGNPYPKVSQAYAGLVERHGNGQLDWTGQVRFLEERLEQPLHWKQPRRIFVNSMSDCFHADVHRQWLADIWSVMQQCPQHQFLILTKRPVRMQTWAQDWGEPLRNVWLGVSCENQATADTRIPLLLQTPAALRFVSYEPALASVDFRQIRLRHQRQVIETVDALYGHGMHYTGALGYCAHLDWVICGGESGADARPFDRAWLRRVVQDCQEAGVPVWVKQDAGPRPGHQGRIPDALWVHELPQS